MPQNKLVTLLGIQLETVPKNEFLSQIPCPNWVLFRHTAELPYVYYTVNSRETDFSGAYSETCP